MRHINNYRLYLFSLLVLMSSCLDKPKELFKVDKPESIAMFEYLNDYEALKSYVDREASPNFKLGAGVNVSDYVKLGMVYRYINANFDMVTAGNAMKYASVVGDDGSMDFSTVMQFVEAAKTAGIGIYGHTLLWHAQQNNKYLNSLIADRELTIDPGNANNALHMKTLSANANVWDWQMFYNLAQALQPGVEYTLKMRVQASEATNVDFWRYDGESQTSYGPGIPVGESWSDVTINLSPTAFAVKTLQFNFGTFAGDLYFDDLSLTAAGSDDNLIANGTFDDDVLTGWEKPGWQAFSFSVGQVSAGPATWWSNLVSNSDIENNDVSNFDATEIGDGPKPASIGPAGSGADGVGRSIVVHSGDTPAQEWDTQFFIKVPHVFETGEAFRFSMKIRADKPAGSSSQAHQQPGQYLHYEMIGGPNFTTNWQEYTYSGIISPAQSGMSTIALNLAVFKEANTYYFDDIYFEIEESGNKIPLTDEEKADTLTWAMDKWISGMMEATSGYVTEWDVVNEPLSGGDMDGDGLYDLQSAKNVSETDAENNFYWQDYLGDNYVRTAVNLARKYGPDNIKLFVNDYNLESDWDDNKKLKSLIQWIGKWEQDGVTVIDGIGTQLHISCYMNPTIQASKENHIVKMFELLAQSGKLVKVTEFDMGLVDADGNPVMTEDVTVEQLNAMSDFYKFIVQKYFEIIPAQQRYGITHWSPTDSPKASSWRGGEPIGLWTEKYVRKPAYAGYADGLKGE